MEASHIFKEAAHEVAQLIRCKTDKPGYGKHARAADVSFALLMLLANLSY